MFHKKSKAVSIFSKWQKWQKKMLNIFFGNSSEEKEGVEEMEEAEKVGTKLQEEKLSQTEEFLDVLRVFHEHPTQWISVFDIMSKTQYKLTVVYPILTWMTGAGLLGTWVFDGARRSYALNEKAFAIISDILERKKMIQENIDSG